MQRLSVFLLLVFLAISVNAQKKGKPKKTKKIPENIEEIKCKFSLSPIYANEYSFFKIKSRQNKNADEMIYRPNILGSVGAKMTIKSFSFTYMRALPQPELLGNTKSTSYIFNLQKRTFGMKLYWMQYEGLYLDKLNRSHLYSELDNGIDSNIILRPDIKMDNIGFQNYFTFLKSFSVNAAFEQTERQKKTAGSFVLMYGANYLGVSNQQGNSLILPSQKDYYPRVYDLYKLNAISFKIDPGIGYSFIIKRYFSFTFLLLGGSNIQHKWYHLDGKTRTRWGPWISLNYEARAAVGYNGKHLLFNLVYSRSQDITGFKTTYDDKPYDCTTNFNFFREFIKFTAGFRIY
jgi:hypothetical protein